LSSNTQSVINTEFPRTPGGLRGATPSPPREATGTDHTRWLRRTRRSQSRSSRRRTATSPRRHERAETAGRTLSGNSPQSPVAPPSCRSRPVVHPVALTTPKRKPFHAPTRSHRHRRRGRSIQPQPLGRRKSPIGADRHPRPAGQPPPTRQPSCPKRPDSIPHGWGTQNNSPPRVDHTNPRDEGVPQVTPVSVRRSAS